MSNAGGSFLLTIRLVNSSQIFLGIEVAVVISVP